MKAPKFFLVTNQQEHPDQEFILCTEKPYLMAKVWRFKQAWKAERFATTSDHIMKVRVPGYDIFICLVGSIEGSVMRFTADWEEKYLKILQEMIEFYRSNKMDLNTYQFNKYKINPE